jgi:hypothetical protein
MPAFLKRNMIYAVVILAIICLSITAFCHTYTKEIYFSTPFYLKRGGTPWEKFGRLAGILKNQPGEFTIEIYSHTRGALIRTEKHYGFLSVFQTDWLAPGTYTFTFKTQGYEPSPLKSLKIEDGSDCLLNVEFGKTAYKRNY